MRSCAARAREALAEARLAAGETDGLVTELMALVDAEPLRERPRALLMSALVATVRTVEALRTYDDYRRLVGDQLGIEPSPALAAQHAGLLAGAAVGEVRVSGGRLPVPPTPLVGREQLVAEVLALVRSNRSVSLVGPGGVGKTRLLVEIGHRLRAERPEWPVVLCELAQADEGSALDVVGAALGIDARPGVPRLNRIASVLGDSELVVLLDNCEHVSWPLPATTASASYASRPPPVSTAPTTPIPGHRPGSARSAAGRPQPPWRCSA